MYCDIFTSGLLASYCFLKSGGNANICILKSFPWIFQKIKTREMGEGVLRTHISSIVWRLIDSRTLCSSICGSLGSLADSNCVNLNQVALHAVLKPVSVIWVPPSFEYPRIQIPSVMVPPMGYLKQWFTLMRKWNEKD